MKETSSQSRAGQDMIDVNASRYVRSKCLTRQGTNGVNASEGGLTVAKTNANDASSRVTM